MQSFGLMLDARQKHPAFLSELVFHGGLQSNQTSHVHHRYAGKNQNYGMTLSVV